MGKDQARRETWNETRPPFRAGRNPQASARLAPRGEADEKSPPGRFTSGGRPRPRHSRKSLAQELFSLAAYAQVKGWSAEELLRREIRKCERVLRQREQGRKQFQPARNGEAGRRNAA